MRKISIITLLIIISGCNGQSPNIDQFYVDWKNYVSPIINNIDIDSGQSLYNSQMELSFPVYSIFRLNRKNEIDEIVSALYEIIKTLPLLSELRNNTEVSISDFLANPERSGFNDRKIYPTVNKDGVIVHEELNLLQFSYLISQVLKYLAQKGEYQSNYIHNEFVKIGLDFLYNDIVAPLYMNVESSWYVGVNKDGSFNNMKERITTKFNYSEYLYLNEKSYYKAITDYELFLMAIAADLRFTINNTNGEEYAYLVDKEILDEINDLSYKIFKQRVSSDIGDYFVFDKGAWTDHPDHAYEGYDGVYYPTATAIKINSAWDSSHSLRFPLWLMSFMDANEINSEAYNYWRNLLFKLGEQFFGKVVVLSNDGVLDIYDGTVRVQEPGGEIVADFEPKEYTKYYGEHVPKHSYATHMYYKPAGYPEGVWRANTLARCNVNEKMATPLADAALKEMREIVGRPSHHTFAYHYARIVELVQAFEWCATLLKDPDIVSTDVKLSDVEPKAGDGVGIVEAPRGILLHNYISDDKGMLTKANLVVATNNNIAGIEKSLMVAAKQIFEDKAHESLKLPEPMVKR